ncbi:hypothetical protein C8Q76DRAFT_466185 [Earliella scabrosa]|nr:hypothetical protein C8Q76DRAFT_466185 [Earliella scabrosa]
MPWRTLYILLAPMPSASRVDSAFPGQAIFVATVISCGVERAPSFVPVPGCAGNRVLFLLCSNLTWLWSSDSLSSLSSSSFVFLSSFFRLSFLVPAANLYRLANHPRNIRKVDNNHPSQPLQQPSQSCPAAPRVPVPAAVRFSRQTYSRLSPKSRSPFPFPYGTPPAVFELGASCPYRRRTLPQPDVARRRRICATAVVAWAGDLSSCQSGAGLRRRTSGTSSGRYVLLLTLCLGRLLVTLWPARAFVQR